MALNAKKVFRDLSEQKNSEAETIEVTIGKQVYDVKVFTGLDPNDVIVKQNIYLYVGEFLEDLVKTDLLPGFLDLDTEMLADTLSFFILLRAYTDIDFSDAHGTDLLNFLAVLAKSDLPTILAKMLGDKKLGDFYTISIEIAADVLGQLGDNFTEASKETQIK